MKITNCVDDLHWKSIKYLTDNYGNVLIGNLSTKSIVNNQTSKLSPIIKRIALLMRLYTFKQRLIYKCKRHKIGYAEIDEAYISITCTNCGYLKRDLADAKIYDCKNCGCKIGRYYAGARNILIRSLEV